MNIIPKSDRIKPLIFEKYLDLNNFTTLFYVSYFNHQIINLSSKPIQSNKQLTS